MKQFISKVKIRLVGIGLFFSFILFLATPAQAHFLATDGAIGAVLHIEPNDDPSIGAPVTLFFDIQDKKKQFILAQCSCTVIIQENGQTLDQEPVTAIDSLTSSLSFTFPKRDVYQIQLSGKPLQANSFQPFTITWNIRADRENTSSAANPMYDFITSHLLLLGFSMGIFILLAIQIIKGKK